MKKAICFIASATVVGFGFEYGYMPLVFGGTAGIISAFVWCVMGVVELMN